MDNNQKHQIYSRKKILCSSWTCCISWKVVLKQACWRKLVLWGCILQVQEDHWKGLWSHNHKERRRRDLLDLQGPSWRHEKWLLIWDFRKNIKIRNGCSLARRQEFSVHLHFQEKGPMFWSRNSLIISQIKIRTSTKIICKINNRRRTHHNFRIPDKNRAISRKKSSHWLELRVR